MLNYKRHTLFSLPYKMRLQYLLDCMSCGSQNYISFWTKLVSPESNSFNIHQLNSVKKPLRHEMTTSFCVHRCIILSQNMLQDLKYIFYGSLCNISGVAKLDSVCMLEYIQEHILCASWKRVLLYSLTFIKRMSSYSYRMLNNVISCPRCGQWKQ
jgi:hypothetical protein